MAESGYYVPIPELLAPTVEATPLSPLERLPIVVDALTRAWNEDSELSEAWPNGSPERDITTALVVQDYCDGSLLYRYRINERGDRAMNHANLLSSGAIVDLNSGMNLDRLGYWIKLGSHPRKMMLETMAQRMCYGALRDSVDHRAFEANHYATPRAIRWQRATAARSVA